jgi:hypothetical protein
MTVKSSTEIGGNEPRHGDNLVYEECLDFGGRLKAVIAGIVMAVFGAIFYGSSIVSCDIWAELS